MNRNSNKFVLSILILALLATRSDAQWNRFRGPQGNGLTNGAIPLSWDEQTNVSWKAAVPGRGHSSPVIAAGKIWLTTAITQPLTAEEKKERLSTLKDPRGLDLVGKVSLRALAFDLISGKLLQDIEVFQPQSPEPIHLTNSYASPTPVLHQGKLYVNFGTYGAACLNTDNGAIEWRFNDLKIDHQNGPGSSPVVWEDLLITHYDGTDQQCIVALRLKDGKIAWRTDRSGEMHPTPELQKAYGTPTVAESDAGVELISPAANWVYAYNPRDGSELWKASYGGLGFSTVPCPVVGHQMAYVCTSFSPSRLLAVRLGGKGDVTETHIAWTSKSNISQKPSLALLAGELYVLHDEGILTCLDALTGEEIWRHRIGGKYAASPIVANDRIYFFSQEGKTTVIQAGREYKELAINQLDSGFNASPAIDGDAIILRSDSHLYRIEDRK